MQLLLPLPSPQHRPLRRSIALLLATGILLPALNPQARAAAYLWDVDGATAGAQGGSGTWNTTNTNWLETTNKIWATGNDATFGGGLDGSYAVDVALTTTANSLIFNNSGYTLSAASLQTITVSSTTASVSVANGKSATIGNNVRVSSANTNSASAVTGGGTLIIESGGILRNAGTSSSNVLTLVGTAGGGTGTTLEVKTGGTLANSLASAGNGNAIFVNGSLNVTGGLVDLSGGTGGTFGLGQSATDSAGTITLTSGSILAPSTNGVRFGSNSGTTPGGTLHLNGGVLTTLNLIKGTGTVTTSTVNLNGGILRSTGASTIFMEGLGRANVRDNGAKIDALHALTINQALLHSNIGGDASVDGGLTKTGAGTLILGGANTYTGATTLSNGTLSVATIGDGGVAGNLGAASTAAANLLFNGGTLKYTGANASTNRNFTISESTIATFETTANSLTISGGAPATTGGLAKTGTGTLTLAGASAYSGATSIAAGGGILAAANNALGTTAGSTTVALNGSLGFTGGVNYSTAEPIFGNGGGTTATSVGAFAANQRGFVQSVTGNNTFAGAIQITATGTSRLGTQDGSQLTLSGPVTMASGVSAVTVLVRGGNTNGDFVTFANAGNSWDRDTQVFTSAPSGNAGLRLGINNALPTAVSVLGLNASPSSANSLDLNGFDQTLAGLTSGGGLLKIVNLAASGTSTLTLALTADKSTLNTTIHDGALGGKIALVLNAPFFTQTLAGANTYTGSTTVTAGTLLVSGSLSGSSDVAVQDGASLRGAGSVGNVSVALGGTINPGDTVGAAGPMTVGSGSGTGLGLAAGSHLALEVGGPGSGLSDRINVAAGSGVTLAGELNGTLLNGYTPVEGDLLFIVVNQGAAATTGSFSNTFMLNGKETVSLGGSDFYVSYTADFVAEGSGSNAFTGGNDVALLAVPEPGAAVSLLGGLGLLIGLRRRRTR